MISRFPFGIGRRWTILSLLALGFAGLVAACSGASDGAGITGPFFEEKRIVADVENGTAFVTIEFRNAQLQPVQGSVGISLRDLDGRLIDSASADFEIQGVQFVNLELHGLPNDLELPGTAAYRLDYDVRHSFRRHVGRRSLFEAADRLEVQVLTAGRYATGEDGFLRLFARNPATGLPARDAEVVAVVQLADESEVEVARGYTDDYGALSTEMRFPTELEGNAKLFVRVASNTSEDMAEADVAVLPDARILLTTDKPLYQPGQTIHLRALALDRASRAPMAGAEVLFEVTDGDGNKVFKELRTANEFGIAATTFQLATQVNMGSYRLKAILGPAEVEKEVTVERYVLPKFKVDLQLDKGYYGPGETVNGTVSAQYFFGEPVIGGALEIVASTYDIGFTAFATINGTTNDEGLFSFSFQMPDYVVGQPLEQGNGLVKIDATVVDGADHEQTTTKTTVVAQGDIDVTLVPESGELVADVENDIFVIVSDPLGTPMTADVTVSAEGQTYPIVLDTQGIGIWTFTPSELPVVATVDASQPGEDPVELTLSLGGGGRGSELLLRTDKALYAEGDTLFATVLLPVSNGRVWVDLIHGGRTVATESLSIEDGMGTWHYELDGTLTGALQVGAYYLGEGSEIIRDERLVYVDPSDSLNVTLTADRPVYAPGEPAAVEVHVTDGDGAPKVAALGVQVVDEAVFALQESQPGLLKVYFELEEALSEPHYQLSWPDLTPTAIVTEEPEPGDTVASERQARAEVAFAAQAGGAPAYGVDVNTRRERMSDVKAVVKPYLDATAQTIAADYAEDVGYDWYDWYAMLEEVEAYLQDLHLTDFWGRPFRFVKKSDESWEMWTDGPDKLTGTSDDLSTTINVYDLIYGGGMWGWEGEGDWDAMDGAGGPPAPGAMPDQNTRDDETNTGGDKSSSVRIRKYFPETLYVNPAVITDGNGHATIDLTMADSITSWRMTALGNTADGLLGSTTAGLTVFQDFFVDIDFPATLTRGDEVSVPIAIYNYLDIPQNVTLTAQSADWLEFTNGTTVTVPLDPGQVDAVYFDVRVLDVGTHGLTIVAEGDGGVADGIQRTVIVEPDGKQFQDSRSARFEGGQSPEEPNSDTVNLTIHIPEENIDNAQSLLVKVYPGFFSQCVEGLDSMLRLPTGCFEQTTSSAWPNVLAMAYMRETEQLTPEIEMKASQYVNLGYQRILTFECADGGFNWWEDDNPGNAVLSALACMMLTDTKQVAFVDQAVIERTWAWLESVQQSNGSWTEETHLHAGNENLGGSSLRATAYILWGLAYSGYEGSAINQAMSYLVSESDREEDIYTLAMVANALAAAGHPGGILDQILDNLHEQRIEEEGGLVHWTAGENTMVGAWGDAADIETTALVALALLHGGAYPTDVEGAITWLISKKDPQGNWGYSTQATVLTLKLFLESLRGSGGAAGADVTVAVNGTEVGAQQFTDFNSDVLWQVDATGVAVEGDNEVVLTYSGYGNLMYQVIGSWYVPWEMEPPVTDGSISIDVQYDKTQLQVNDTVVVTVTITNHDPGLTSMILVDLGRPPGFTLMTEDLAALLANGDLSEFEVTDRQIMLYLDPIPAEEPVELSYRLVADYPIQATVPGSSASPYYDAADRSETGDFGIEVN